MEQAAGRRNFFILIASIGALAIFSSTLSKTPVLPLFAADLGATPQEIGWIVIASTIPRGRAGRPDTKLRPASLLCRRHE